MNNRQVTVLVAGILLCSTHGVAQEDKNEAAAAQRVLGEWLTAEGKARVRIERRGDYYYGAIVWLREPEKDGKPVVDDKNPDRRFRDRPVIGLTIVDGFSYDGDGVWSGGTVYDPESGNDYRGKITVVNDSTLELRGYVLIPLFGRSETWTRAE